MSVTRRAGWGLLLLVLVLSVLAATQQPARIPTATLPARLTDRQFWQLSHDLSEPAGYFRSENLVSNEHTYQYVVPDLTRAVTPGGVYLGVAPDQNFTYILATAPRMAFIVDIRRGNLLQHLLYKTLFELSADRGEFVSRLFSKPRPPGVTVETSVAELFSAFAAVETAEPLFRQNLKQVTEHLTRRHGFVLTPDDLAQVEAIYFAFFWDGPAIQYSTGPGFGARGRIPTFPTFEELAMQTDWTGVPRSYLASEAQFLTIKRMQEKNLIVPVVGNFAGPKALRGVGRYVRDHGAVVSAFYVSNVEQYLYQDHQFAEFARNVALLPLDGASLFIRSVSSRFGYTGERLGPDGRASALYPIRTFVQDFQAGRLKTYYDVNSRSR